MLQDEFSIAEVADLLGVTKETLRRWDSTKKLKSKRNPDNNYRYYEKEQLMQFEEIQALYKSNWETELQTKPIKNLLCWSYLLVPVVWH
ncbi:transcriptional regulator, MerR family [Proteus penneri ATCC 35198]|nr:transcriptional regulator, MerR family [Proteus penneri ATCC 35198]